MVDTTLALIARQHASSLKDWVCTDLAYAYSSPRAIGSESVAYFARPRPMPEMGYHPVEWVFSHDSTHTTELAIVLKTNHRNVSFGFRCTCQPGQLERTPCHHAQQMVAALAYLRYSLNFEGFTTDRPVVGARLRPAMLGAVPAPATPTVHTGHQLVLLVSRSGDRTAGSIMVTPALRKGDNGRSKACASIALLELDESEQPLLQAASLLFTGPEGRFDLKTSAQERALKALAAAHRLVGPGGGVVGVSDASASEFLTWKTASRTTQRLAWTGPELLRLTDERAALLDFDAEQLLLLKEPRGLLTQVLGLPDVEASDVEAVAAAWAAHSGLSHLPPPPAQKVLPVREVLVEHVAVLRPDGIRVERYLDGEPYRPSPGIEFVERPTELLKPVLDPGASQRILAKLKAAGFDLWSDQASAAYGVSPSHVLAAARAALGDETRIEVQVEGAKAEILVESHKKPLQPVFNLGLEKDPTDRRRYLVSVSALEPDVQADPLAWPKRYPADQKPWSALVRNKGNKLQLLAEIRPNTFAWVVQKSWNEALDHLRLLDGFVKRQPGRATLSRGALAALARRGVFLPGAARETTEALAACVDLIDAKDTVAAGDIPGFTAVLKPFQSKAVSWLLALREHGFGGVLGDDRGMGKTLMVLATIAAHRASCLDKGFECGPQLVVVERKELVHWKRTIATFAPELPYHLHHGASKADSLDQLADKAFVLTTYETLLKYIEFLQPLSPDFVFTDEARALKNPTTKKWQTIASFGSATLVPITGTPIDRSINDLRSLLELAAPGLLGTIRDFGKRYDAAAANPSHPDSVAFLRELRLVLEPFFLRRLKKDVPDEFPQKQEFTYPVDLDSSEARAYEAIRVRELEEVARIRATLPKQQQAVAIRHVLERVRKAAAAAMIDSKKPTSKGAYLLQAVQDLLLGGHSVLIFSHFEPIIEQLTRLLKLHAIDHSVYSGDAGKRDRQLLAFKDGSTRVMLVNKHGASGLDLPEADTVILYDGWINQAEMDQMGDRAHRLISESEVTVYKLVAAGTIEDVAAQLLERFQGATQAVLDGQGDSVARLHLTDEDYDRLLAPMDTVLAQSTRAAAPAAAAKQPGVAAGSAPGGEEASSCIVPAGPRRLAQVRRSLEVLDALALGEDVVGIAEKHGVSPARIYQLIPKAATICLNRTVDLFPDASRFPALEPDALFFPGDVVGARDVSSNAGFWRRRVAAVLAALEPVAS